MKAVIRIACWTAFIALCAYLGQLFAPTTLQPEFIYGAMAAGLLFLLVFIDWASRNESQRVVGWFEDLEKKTENRIGLVEYRLEKRISELEEENLELSSRLRELERS